MLSSGLVSRNFNLLPTEIQCHILKQTPDLRTLRALINASPRYFEVYKAFETPILSEITRNAITPELLQIAMDAHQQRERYRGEQKRDSAAVHAYLRESFLAGKPVGPEHKGIFPLETSTALLQFHETVEYFVSDFANNRLTLIQQNLLSKTVSSGNEWRSSEKASDPKPAAELSRTEHFRLVRAFYYLELYGQLFCTTIGISTSGPSERQQWTLFLQQFRDFELEELLCGRRYLIDKLVVYLSQIEDEFVNEYMNERLYLVEPHKPESRWDDDDWFFSCDGHYEISYWLEDCLTVGLEELKTMFTADTMDDRFYSLRCMFRPQGILSNALNAMPKYTPESKIMKDQKPLVHTGFRDDVDKGSLGWFWLLNEMGHPRQSSNYAHSNLLEASRRWGYVIWDHNRLLSFGALTKRCATRRFPNILHSANDRCL